MRRSLEAVLAQHYPPDLMEVIVVDGMSQDDTRAIVREVAASNKRVVMIDNPRRITPCAMNLGIRQAKGEVVFRVDGHAVIPPDYVSGCLKCLAREDVEGVGGAIGSEGTNYIGQAIAVGMSSPFGIGSSGFRTSKGNHGQAVLADTLPFWAFPRRVFERIGLFNEQMVRHQDYEFNYRLRSSGGKLLLLPWLRVKYYVRSTLPQFWRQYWQYGVWKGRFLRTYPRAARLRHFVPPLFVLAASTTTMLAVLGVPSAGSGLVLLAGLYAGFLAVATLSLAARGHIKEAPLVPLILLSLHLTWGTGVWVGLVSGKTAKSASRLHPAPTP